MESFVDGICNLIGFYLALGTMLGLYIAPLIIATVRDHHRLPWIGLLNFAAGWTVVDRRPGVVSDSKVRASSGHADRQHCTQDRSTPSGVNRTRG